MRASKPLGVALLAAAALAASCVVAHPIPHHPKPPPAPHQQVVFYDVLAPHGEWFYMGPYGYVWRPYRSVVGVGFQPYYTGGYWIYTSDGWAFESDWSWGWAVYHYGRWIYVDGPGWVWVPGTEWAPAWVTWRFGGGYVGWYPLPPPGVSISMGVYSPGWIFVHAGHFTHRHFHRYVLPEPERRHVFHEATPVGPRFGRPVGPAPRSIAQHGATIPRGTPSGPKRVASGATAVPPGAAVGRPRSQPEVEQAPRVPPGRPAGEPAPRVEPQSRPATPPPGRPAEPPPPSEVRRPAPEQPRGDAHPATPPPGQPAGQKQQEKRR